MNIAFVGYGSIAREHALAIRRIAGEHSDWDLRLVGVMGRLREPAQEFADAFGMALATTDLDELLGDPRVDAVIVCSPTDLHAEQTERTLRAGKHVLCEIPLATSLAETDRLIGLADASKLRLMVCHTQRYTRPLQEARRMIAAGEVHPYAVVARYLLDKRENVTWTGRRRGWTDNLLWHHGCHAVDAALWLLGDEAEAVSAMTTPADDRLGIPMDLGVVLRTSRHRLATVAMTYRARPPLLDYLIVCEETTLVCTSSELRDHRGILLSAEGPALFGDGSIDRQDAAFFEWIATGGEPAASARRIRPAMAALQTAEDDINRTG